MTLTFLVVICILGSIERRMLLFNTRKQKQKKCVMQIYAVKQKEETRFFIEKALFECLEDHLWSELSVTLLCHQAQISRKTFYRHYPSLNGCLDQWFSSLEAKYLKTCPVLDHYDFSQICSDFFQFWKPYRRQLRLLQNAQYDLQSAFFQSAYRIIHIRSDHRCSDSLCSFSSGGFYSLLCDWLNQPLEN